MASSVQVLHYHATERASPHADPATCILVRFLRQRAHKDTNELAPAIGREMSKVFHGNAAKQVRVNHDLLSDDVTEIARLTIQRNGGNEAATRDSQPATGTEEWEQHRDLC